MRYHGDEAGSSPAARALLPAHGGADGATEYVGPRCVDLPEDLMPAFPGTRDPLTARLVRALAGHPGGLPKADLLVLFYPDYPRASNLRRSSLEVCLNKLLQRARARYAPLGVVISFDRASRRWQVKFLQRHPAR